MDKKLIIIPDSFKGSISSEDVADTLEEVILAETDYKTVKIPIADGGEGSTECILKSLGGDRVKETVHSPENTLIEAMYGVTPDQTAVVEIAESSGITRQTTYNAMEATSIGFGELILAALNKGIRKFLLCLGGSATTDCGCGMAAALGVKFYDTKGNEFVPVGGTLKKVAQIDMSTLDPRVKESSFTVMSDVENPLYGKKGAAYVYGPQKGASKEQVVSLDAGLVHISKAMVKAGLIPCDSIKGAGAAGGAGYGCVAFLGAEIKSGIHGMLDICQFDSLIKDAAGVVTGEGKIDEQSLMGKVLSGICERALGKPIIAFCGVCDIDTAILTERGVKAVEIGRGIPVDEAMALGRWLLRDKAEEFFKEQKEIV